MGMLTWIYGLGEQALTSVAETLFASPRFTGAIVKGAQRVAETKGTVDRNVNGVLGMLGLPSKADYNRLLSKVEVLQGSLVNLNIKVDRLLAVRERPHREPPDGQSGERAATDPTPESA
jgi:hypothetical protein